MLFKAWEKTHLVRVESACSTEALISSPRTQVKSLVQSQCWGEDWWTSEALWSSSLEELVNLSQKKKNVVWLWETSSVDLFTCIRMLRKKAYCLLYFLVIFLKIIFFFLQENFYSSGMALDKWVLRHQPTTKTVASVFFETLSWNCGFGLQIKWTLGD